MERVSRIKGAGYLISSASVILLAVPGLKAAMESPLYALCLGLGAAASIGGMMLRWRSHRLEQQKR
jgi:drug/metabolite transporter (DMT)-like permease